MIRGHIQLEDHIIDFDTDTDKGTVTFTVTEDDRAETRTVDQAAFFKALAIAVHNDGTPDYNVDYPDAESTQGEIRWIP